MSGESGTLSGLRYMANQIAANLATIKPDNAALATADHINRFWDPRMRQLIFEDIKGEGRDILSPVALAAIEHLASGAEPASQTRGTQFNAVNEIGHSDAG